MQQINSQFKTIMSVADERMEPIDRDRTNTHLARLLAAYERYNIKSTDQTFNLGECDILFRDVAGQSKRKEIRSQTENLVTTVEKTKENSERPTVLSVFNAAAVLLKTHIVSPRKQI